MNPGGKLSGQPFIEAPLEFRLRSGGAPAKDAAFITCPKCEAPCFIRRSERITERVKHLHAHCTNTGCAHTFLAEVSFVHSFSPGLLDRKDLDLPICPRDKVPHVLPPRGGEDHPDQHSMFGAGT
jgi:hypothetical protein